MTRFLLKQPSQFGDLMELITRAQQEAPKGLEITVTPLDSRRSLSQNALIYCLFDQFAKAMNKRLVAADGDFRWTAGLVHDMSLAALKGVTETVLPDGRRITRYPKTSSMTKGEMADFIDRFRQWASELGIVLRIPADSEYMRYKEAQG